MTQKFFEKKPILIEKKEYLFKSQLFHKFTNIKKEGGLRTKNKFKKSYPLNPLISVITVVKNGEKNLKRCIETIVSKINIHILSEGDSGLSFQLKDISLPVKLTEEHIEILLKTDIKNDKPPYGMYL